MNTWIQKNSEKFNDMDEAGCFLSMYIDGDPITRTRSVILAMSLVYVSRLPVTSEWHHMYLYLN